MGRISHAIVILLFISFLTVPSLLVRGEPQGGSSGGASEVSSSSSVKLAGDGATIAVICTWIDVTGSVLKTLDYMGYSYDYYYHAFPADYSSYRIIIEGVDGTGQYGHNDGQIQQLSDFVKSGGCAIIIGGSSLIEYPQAVNTYLMTIDISDYGWEMVSSTPHITIVNPSPLASDLPVTHNFANIMATWYMLRITDPSVNVVAVNGDGYKAIVWKNLGSGRFTYFINIPDPDYWTDASDYSYLKTLIGNAISQCARSPPVGGELVLTTVPTAVAPFILLLGAVGIGIIVRKRKTL